MNKNFLLLWLGISWGKEETSYCGLKGNAVGTNYVETKIVILAYSLLHVDWSIRNEGII